MRRSTLAWQAPIIVYRTDMHERSRRSGNIRQRTSHTIRYDTIRDAILWAYYNCDTSTIRQQHATTRYEVFCALAYEIDSSTPRESVVGVSCMLIDSSMHTIFTLYLYRPSGLPYIVSIQLFTVKLVMLK